MSVLPIDLQTLFSQMNQVGKEQSIIRHVAPEAQAFQASELVKEAEQRDKSVNQSREVGEGLEKVKEEEGSRERRKSSRDKAQRKGAHPAAPEKNVFRDPYLGQNIDIIR
ncbi:MAG TPA: hypothetical protein VMX75_11535 [Spirochaetia bacterium]|nr:hypothetical protein [Spirochaetia bacterium]